MANINQKPVALVTGAAGVLGEAVARRLHAGGQMVVLLDVDENGLQAISESMGESAVAIKLDVSDPQAVASVCEDIQKNYGAIQILVNNAGILSNNKAAQTSNEEWRRVLSINLDGAFYLSRACLPEMKTRGFGRIINVCSLAMKTGGLTAGTAYTTSKGAMGAMTFSLARESAKFGVTVNGIAPAYINTPMVTEQLTEEQRQKLLHDIPVGRFCEADEVAELVYYLSRPIAGFITGEIIDINGGLHLD
jgi:3-oxoacyl-[acyl-carrier protein] reductase